ncbi:class II aldolase/adducin family protein [Leifsonia kafniensis]|uniref:Class II aldolase/adducin family protein n=1 Tax=Leifsonia kafniensis TaxID=475957 RepID=A0ABP7KW79_9MICO
MSDDAMIAQVVGAHRALAATGQSDLIWGHIAIRDPHGRGVWSKASGWGMEDLTSDRVVLVSFDGEVLVGTGKRHLEVPIHTELMRQRPDIGATVHSHAEAAVAFASLGVPLRAISHAATPFLGDDVRRFTRTANLISTPELGISLAEAVGDENGCLIPGHGLVAVGVDVAHAVMHAVLLERACATQLRAMASGPIRVWTSDAEVASKRAEIWPASSMRAAYAHLVRRAVGVRVDDLSSP